jgi:hypothetical protein
MKKIYLYTALLCLCQSLAFGNISCLDGKETLQIDNNKAVNIKLFQEHGFKTRAYLKGFAIKETENRQGHTHIEVDLNLSSEDNDDQIELIFNNQYGDLPDIKGGEEVIMCGDYIVDHYSKNKAVIHWVHKSPNQKKHNHGFIIINNVVYGLN